MVRAARNSNIAMLLQPGQTLLDVTHEYMLAISHAQTILSWYENLPEDEMPPEWMWPFSDELEEHFEEVKFARKQKYSGHSDDDWGDNMMENVWQPGD